MSTLAAKSDWLLAATGSRAADFYESIGVAVQANGHEAAVSCFSNPAAHSNDDRNKSCSINLVTGLWKCHGCGQSGNAYQAGLALGLDEKRSRELAQQFGVFLEKDPRDKPRMPTEPQLKKLRSQLADSPKVIKRAQVVKGWSWPALIRCGVGWDGSRFTFTIRNHKLKCVGVVRYTPRPKGKERKTKADPGSQRLFFPAPEVLCSKFPLFVVEGEPDAISVRSCGHQAVAVPGTGSWKPEWVGRLRRFERVIVLADADPQGRDLAARIKQTMPRVTVVDVAPEREDGYDIGDLVSEAAAEGGVWQIKRLLDLISGRQRNADAGSANAPVNVRGESSSTASVEDLVNVRSLAA